MAWAGCRLRGSATGLVFFAIELMSWYILGDILDKIGDVAEGCTCIFQ